MMATAIAERQPVEVTQFPYTVADLAVLPSDLPSGYRRYELDNGRLITLPPADDQHGAVEANLAAQLKNRGEHRRLGRARSGGLAIVLWCNPDRVGGADAVFIANASLPIQRSPEGYLETIPDLVVEVVSKNDTRPYVSQKVSDYLAAGVKVVWVADPPSRTIAEHRPGVEPVMHRPEDVLTVEDLLPGFRMQVADAFEE